MVAYVVDAGREATGAAPARRHVAPRPPPSATRSATTSTTRSRPSRAAPATPSRPPSPRCPDDVDEVLVLTGDVPLLEAGAARASCSTSAASTRPRSRSIAVDAIDPGDLGRVVRDEAGIVERIVERKDATDEEIAVNEINSGLYAFDAAWLRGADRRRSSASPKTGELYLTELVELARADGRRRRRADRRGRRPAARDQRPGRARPGRVGPADADQRRPHDRAGVTMRDPSTVYVDATRHARRGRHDRAERHPPRRDVGRGGDHDRRRQPDRRQHDRRGLPRLGERSSSRRSSRTARRSGRSATSGRDRIVGPDAEVGNFAELKNTRLGRGREAAPHELPRRRRARRRARTSAPARSPPTSTAGRSTGRRSASGSSSASTRCSARRSRSATTRRPAPARSSRKDVPPGKLAVGVPARIREPAPKPPPDRDDEPAMTAPLSSSILVIVLLTLLEGFFVAGEIALVSIRRSRVEQLVDEGSRGRPARPPAARRAGPVPRRLAARPDGHRLLRLGLRRGQPRREPRRRSCVEARARRRAPPTALALVIVTVILALFTIVFAELVPEDARPRQHRSGSRSPCRCPIDFLARALGPLIRLLTGDHGAIAGAVRRERHRTRPRSPPRSSG